MLAILFGNIMTPVFGASYEPMYVLQVVIPLFVDATICFFGQNQIEIPLCKC